MKNRLMKLIKNNNIRKAALGIALLLIVNITISGTAAYLFYETEPIINTFESGVEPYGTVELTADVKHDYGDDYVIPDGIVFPFEINLGEDCAGESFGDYTADENGVIKVPMKAGDKLALKKVPAGTEVTVTAGKLPDGFTVVGEAARTQTVEKAKTAQFEYINKYKAEKPDCNNIAVNGTVDIEGRDWLDGDSYEIVFAQLIDDEWTEISTKTVSKDNKSFDVTDAIKGVKFNNIGTYSFRTYETEGSAGGITYDTNVSELTVKVTDDDMDGKMEVTEITTSTPKNTTVTTKDSKIDVAISFVNKYAPEGSVETFIYITKKLEVISGEDRSLEGYKFVLYDEDRQKAGEAITDANGKAEIKSVFEPKDAGREFTYKLKETNLDEPGIVYDDTVHSIKVNVVDNFDGTISAYIYDAKHPDEGGSTCYVDFTNKYAPTPAKAEITGKKILEGRSLKDSEFSFILNEADEGFASKKIVSETKNTKDGSFEFDKLTFNSEGKYYYIVTEKKDEKAEGITFDKSLYNITVNVYDDEEGHLYAETDISKVSDEVVCSTDKISFTNTYKTPVVPEKEKNDGAKNDGAKTGDSTDLALWLLLLLTSFEGLVILLVIYAIKRKQENC